MARRGKGYSVGRGHPPRHTQFKPGQSGNPKGRPKGSGRLSKVARQEAKRAVAFTEHGVRKKLAADRLLVRQTFAKALSGDPRARAEAFKLLGKVEEKAPDESPIDEEALNTPEDRLVIASIVRRIRSMDAPPDENADDIPSSSDFPKPASTK